MACNGLVDCFAVIGLEEDNGAISDSAPTGKRSVVKFHTAGRATSVTLAMKEGVNALAQFAWPKLRFESKRATMTPFKYTFALTLKDGQYLYGFCHKMLPPNESNRYDKGARFPEVLCLTSTRFEMDLFYSLLDCLAGRRLFDSGSCNSLFRSVCDMTPTPQPGESFRVRNRTLGMQCEYNFTRPRVGEKARCAKILDHLTPKMLHYVVGAVMCEQRIIFMSKSEMTISDVVHGVMALIAPFVWQHMFVPLMPEHLLDYLAAPSPYVVGVLRCFEGRLKDLPLSGYILADLDLNQIRSTVNDVVQPFGAMPTEKQSRIPTRREDESLRLSAVFAAEVLALYNKAKSNKMQVDERRLRVIWLAFSMSVFGYVTNFINPQTLNIDKDRFVRTVADPQLRAFALVFVNTQAFNHFVERQYDHMQRQLQIKSSSALHVQQRGKTGGFREPEEAIMLQRAEDHVFRAALAQLPSDFSLTDAKRAVRQHLPERACAPSEGMIQDVLDVIPSTLKAGLTYSLDDDEHFARVARRSYDSIQAKACMEAIWIRVRAAALLDKGWRYGYNAVLLLTYLISAGSEIILTSAMEKITLLAILLRTRSSGGKTDTAKILRRVTKELFTNLLDLTKIKWMRSPTGGHKLFLASTRATDAKQLQALKCNSSSWPRFNDLHQFTLNPHVSLKPVLPPPVRTPLSIPQPRVPSEDLLGLSVFDEGPPPPSPPRKSASSSISPLSTWRPELISSSQTAPPPPPPRAFETSQTTTPAAAGAPPSLPPRAFETPQRATPEAAGAPPSPPPRAFETSQTTTPAAAGAPPSPRPRAFEISQTTTPTAAGAPPSLRPRAFETSQTTTPAAADVPPPSRPPPTRVFETAAAVGASLQPPILARSRTPPLPVPPVAADVAVKAHVPTRAAPRRSSVGQKRDVGDKQKQEWDNRSHLSPQPPLRAPPSRSPTSPHGGVTIDYAVRRHPHHPMHPPVTPSSVGRKASTTNEEPKIQRPPAPVTPSPPKPARSPVVEQQSSDAEVPLKNKSKDQQ